jgi:5-methyltetrahydrofolate--homocysteine methyltransferase
VEGLVEGGVDLFLVETMPSLDQARAAVDAVRALSALPIVVSMTFNEEGTTFYGDRPEDVALYGNFLL